MTDGWTDDDWRAVVEDVLIVSVDCLVCSAGDVLLGKRTNEPAKRHWFPPGGRVRKGDDA
jgi:colanic acid biosynthesis protein WcaH